MPACLSGSEVISRSTRLLAATFWNKAELDSSDCIDHTNTNAETHQTPRHNKHSHTWFTDLLICGFGLYLRFGLWDQKKGIDPRVCKRMGIVVNSQTSKVPCHWKADCFSSQIYPYTLSLHLGPVSSSLSWCYLDKRSLAPLVMHNLFCFNKIGSMSFWINTCAAKRPG